MDKKALLIMGIFSGIALYYVPKIFLKGSAAILPLKILGMTIMFGSVLWVVAGDTIMGFFGKGTHNFEKDIKKQLKSGEITQEEAYVKEMRALDNEILKQKKLAELQHKKTELQKLKEASKPKMDLGGLLGGESSQKKESMFPDVLGNIGGLMGGGPPQQVTPTTRNPKVIKKVRQQIQQPQPDPLTELNAYVNPKHTSQVVPELNNFAEPVKKKPRKKPSKNVKKATYKSPVKKKKTYSSSRIGRSGFDGDYFW